MTTRATVVDQYYNVNGVTFNHINDIQQLQQSLIPIIFNINDETIFVTIKMLFLISYISN